MILGHPVFLPAKTERTIEEYQVLTTTESQYPSISNINGSMLYDTWRETLFVILNRQIWPQNFALLLQYYSLALEISLKLQEDARRVIDRECNNLNSKFKFQIQRISNYISNNKDNTIQTLLYIQHFGIHYNVYSGVRNSSTRYVC